MKYVILCVVLQTVCAGMKQANAKEAAGKTLHKNFSGIIYDKKVKQKALYYFKFKNEIKGDSFIEESLYTYAEKPKEVAIKEVVTYYDKNKTNRYRYDIHHKQLKEIWSVEVSKEKLRFSKKKTDREQEQFDEEKFPSNFVIGPTLLTYLQKNWKEVLEGKKCLVKFAVLGRMETIGFSVFLHKDKEMMQNNPYKESVILKMRPTNFFISLLVDPLYLYVSKTGGKLFKAIGRTLPRQLKDGDWKDMDAITVFSY